MKQIVVLILTVLLLAGCTKTQSISGNFEPQTPVTEETVQEESVQEESHTVALEDSIIVVESSEGPQPEDSTIVVESSEELQPEDSNPEEPIKNENAEETDPEIAGGTTLEEAQMLEPGIRYTGEYEEGYLWVGFTTGAEEEVPYYITLTNLTVGSDDLELYMFDASETQVNPVARNNDGYYKPFCVAKQNGIAAYGMSDELQPKTTYYLRIGGREKTSFSLCISTPEQPVPAMEREILDSREQLPVRTNQDEADLLEPGVRYNGKYEEGHHWFAFTTGPEEDVPYTIVLDNLTVGSDDLEIYVYDIYGRQVVPTDRNNDGYYKPFCVAGQNGLVAFGANHELEPDSTYFLRLVGKGKALYSLVVSTPDFQVPEIKRQMPDPEETLPAKTNQDEADLLQTGMSYVGEYEAAPLWFAFTTGPDEDVPYTITLENTTVGSNDLYAYVYDIYGRKIVPTAANNSDYYRAFCVAKQDGNANSGESNELDPNTTYFVRISGNGKADFVLTVSIPGQSAPGVNSGDEAEVSGNEQIVPGTSKSSALNIPLGTKVFGKSEGGYSWLAFTTTDVEDAPYYITMVNETVGSNDIYAYLYDAYGHTIVPTKAMNSDYYQAICVVSQNGTANTGMVDTLEPNTTYYVRFNAENKTRYSFRVTTEMEEEAEGYQTNSNINETNTGLREEDTFFVGTNQNASTMLKVNTPYHGHYEDGYGWVCFTTGPEDDVPYMVTLENLTPGSEELYAYMFDDYGYKQVPTECDNSDYYSAMCIARQDGTPNTGMVDYLEPNTIYYIRIKGGSEAEYTIIIGTLEQEDSGNTLEEVEEEEPESEMVFTVPFELNETQIRFVANQAIFINEEEAKENLAPVAEKILAYPEHPILLAGSTATYGSQEECLALSSARAEAVKNLLVEEFGVPEEQLITVGLGYAADPFVRGQDVDANGNFVETEGAKNRRVVVLDAESEIAQQILAEQE